MSWVRRFSRKEILDFAELSGDRGSHHVKEERVMAHGLLVATLPTKLGGDINFIARDMHFEFLQAVYEGDRIECIAEITSWQELRSRIDCAFSFVCKNELGQRVMQGTSFGYIWKKTGSFAN